MINLTKYDGLNKRNIIKYVKNVNAWNLLLIVDVQLVGIGSLFWRYRAKTSQKIIKIKRSLNVLYDGKRDRKRKKIKKIV